jgi:hypothetical protein
MNASYRLGHGFGRFGSMGVTLEPAYDDAREALQRARATVFCLDVTNADYRWIAAITAFVLLEKLAPQGPRVARVAAAIMIAAGAWLLRPGA